MDEIYIVVQGGVVQYVSSNIKPDNMATYVIDLDDIADDPDNSEEQTNLLQVANQLPRIW